MAFHPRRAAGPTRRLRHLAASSAVVLGLVGGLASCGFDMQTMEPYTPSDGVNRDIGGLKARNLMILSKTEGSGFLSGSMLSEGQDDQLTAVTGVSVKADGSPGQQLTMSLSQPVALSNGVLVVLTKQAPISVTGADLKSGLEANLELTFAKAGKLSLTVPVVDANAREYATVTPSPAATPSS